MVKIKNCWLILNYYGYDMNLKLWVEEAETLMTIEKYYSLYLGREFGQFLEDTFNYYSSNKFWLVLKDIKNIFKTINSEDLDLLF